MIGGLVSYWILKQKGMVTPRKKFQRLTSIEKDTDEFNFIVSEFDTEISCRFKEEEDLTYYGSKSNPE